MAAESKAISQVRNNGIQINRKLLNNPEKLRDTCISKALTVSGEARRLDELLAEIEKDRLFYREDGGVCLSGGEPLSQGEELISLLEKFKERKINTDIETSLHVNWNNVARCIGLVDTFLVDLKHTDKIKFKTYIHGDADLVMTNLAKLARSDARVIVRIPVIPGFNHSEHEMEQMIEFVCGLHHVKEIHFLPYHAFGVAKYKMLGMEYAFDQVEQVQESDLEPYIQYAQLKGFETKIGG